ncbi:MAG: hypothetical protein ACYC7D_16055 [Nitrososphaerales archaeon]
MMNDKVILTALKEGPLSAVEITKFLAKNDLKLSRSSVISSLHSRKSSLGSRGLVARIGSKFQITEAGKLECDRIARVINEERDYLGNLDSIWEKTSLGSVVHEHFDQTSGEALGFTTWLDWRLVADHTDLKKDPGNVETCIIAQRKKLHRWLYRPVDLGRLTSELFPMQIIEDSVILNKHYIGFVFSALILALLTQRRRLAVTRPRYFSDIAVIRSKSLRNLDPGELELTLNELFDIAEKRIRQKRKISMKNLG